jgi:hypothetical protein
LSECNILLATKITIKTSLVIYLHFFENKLKLQPIFFVPRFFNAYYSYLIIKERYYDKKNINGFNFT